MKSEFIRWIDASKMDKIIDIRVETQRVIIYYEVSDEYMKEYNLEYKKRQLIIADYEGEKLVRDGACTEQMSW